jgi:(S)-mandelate dehydrogenase
MDLDACACIDDLGKVCRRRLPDFAFDFLAGGAGNDRGIARNESALHDILFRPRGFATGSPEVSVQLFGKTYAQPFGVAPVGIANLTWPGADVMLARLAKEKSIPYTLSTAASTSIEDIAHAAPDTAWYQLYMTGREDINDDMLKRAAAVGIDTLAVTIDIPIASRRNRNIRQHFDVPFRFRTRYFVAGALHPSWALATVQAGLPKPATQIRYADKPTVEATTQLLRSNPKGGVKLADVRRLRDIWPGRLLVKGVLDARDALDIQETGADGVWVSNHGGRQLESAPASIDVLPSIRAAVGPDYPIMFDSGIRGGEDIVKAYALGASFVFCGRAFMYGVGAGAERGAAKSFEILADETRRALFQMGCPSISALGPDWIANPPPIVPPRLP